jgi:hypothetical protein
MNKSLFHFVSFHPFVWWPPQQPMRNVAWLFHFIYDCFGDHEDVEMQQ